VGARALEMVFARVITEREHTGPAWNSTGDFLTLARDGAMVYGWHWHPPAHRNGTIILVHGFRQHCGRSDYWNLLRDLCPVRGMAAAALDLRHHGNSGNAIPTFGTAEAWDIAALLDELELRASPRPFVLIGDSLGGMAVQCLARDDHRVDAAACLHTPGWPRLAVRVAVGRRMGPVRRLLHLPAVQGSAIAAGVIDMLYGLPVLELGDLRSGHLSPAWRPPLLYVMGDEDQYGIRNTHTIWERWYPGEPAHAELRPSRARAQNKWFITVKGAGHPGDHPSTVFNWKGLRPLLGEFIDVALERAKNGGEGSGKGR